jgi:hypothetical protein
MPLDAIDRVLNDGDHESQLWCQRSTSPEVLRRQDDVGLQHADGDSRQIAIHFCWHACLYNGA